MAHRVGSIMAPPVMMTTGSWASSAFMKHASSSFMKTPPGVTFPGSFQAGASVNKMVSSSASSAASSSSASSSGVVAEKLENYTAVHQLLHWLMAGAAITCFTTVNIAQQSKDKKTKGDMMHLHKSAGTLAAMLLVPRVGIRLASKLPALPSGHALEHLAARIGHAGLYAGMTIMPVTGVVMGYYGGKGLPFFTTTIPGAPKEKRNGKLAGQAFKIHKKLGIPFEALFGAHIGAVGYHHVVKNQPILWGMLGGHAVA